MNIFTKAIANLSLKMAEMVTGQSYSLMDAALGKALGGDVSYSGKAVNEKSMMSIAAAWGCVRVLCETVGSVPWGIYEDDGKGNATKVDHPLSDVLIGSPNADMTGVEYRESEVLNLCQRGNAYSLIDRGGTGQVSSLYPVPACNAYPVRNKDTGAVEFKVLDRGKWETYPREKVWHVKGFGQGIEGLSPLGAAREAFGSALAADELGARVFQQGGMPAGFVSIPGTLKLDERALARETLNQLVGGMSNAGKIALFEKGWKPEAWQGMPLEDMQFLSLRQFSVEEVCRFYRVPPHMVADLTHATFSNIENLSLQFVIYTLLPYFTRFEASAAKWLFKPGERSRFSLKFNAEGLLRGDSASRAEFLAKMRQNGFITGNEGRAKENLNRSTDPGMDEFIVQSNMVPVSKIIGLADAQIANANKPATVPASLPAKEHQAGNTLHVELPESIKQMVANMNTPSIEDLSGHLVTAMHKEVDDRLESVESLSTELRATVNRNAIVVKSLADSVIELAASVKKIADQTSLSNAALIASIKLVSEESEKSSEEIRKLASADRIAIFDDDGNPIGTRVVTH